MTRTIHMVASICWQWIRKCAEGRAPADKWIGSGASALRDVEADGGGLTRSGEAPHGETEWASWTTDELMGWMLARRRLTWEVRRLVNDGMDDLPPVQVEWTRPKGGLRDVGTVGGYMMME